MIGVWCAHAPHRHTPQPRLENPRVGGSTPPLATNRAISATTARFPRQSTRQMCSSMLAQVRAHHRVDQFPVRVLVQADQIFVFERLLRRSGRRCGQPQRLEERARGGVFDLPGLRKPYQQRPLTARCRCSASAADASAPRGPVRPGSSPPCAAEPGPTCGCCRRRCHVAGDARRRGCSGKPGRNRPRAVRDATAR
jgi:hypothetical protein